LLRASGVQVNSRPVFLKKLSDLRSKTLEREVIRIYRSLGGVQLVPRIAPGRWDVGLAQCVVELDEERHFNRYREVTLGSSVYHSLRGFDVNDYRRLCINRENECLRCAKHGNYWTTNRAEREFGPSSAPGSLDGIGPSRWKQRAFYDFIKDISPVSLGIPAARLSIWDVIDVAGRAVSIGQVLDGRIGDIDDSLIGRYLLDEVRRRTIS
jgi:hypothetical protein